MAGLFDTMKQKGEERLSALTGEWLANERFMAAVEAALSTKGFLERQLKRVLHTMSVASRLDIDELHSKLADSDRKLRQMTKRFEALQRQMEETQATAQAAAKASESTAARATTAEQAASAASTAAEAAASVETAQEAAAVAEVPVASAAPAASGTEANCVACGKTFQKKSFNQRFCSAACRSGV